MGFLLLAFVCCSVEAFQAPARAAVRSQSAAVSMSTQFTDPFVQRMKKKNPMTGSTKNLKGYTVGSRAPRVAKNSGTTVLKGYATNGGIGGTSKNTQNVPTLAVIGVPVGLVVGLDFLGKVWG